MKRWLAAVVLVLSACQRAQPPLPTFGSVPGFTLTSQDGKEFSSTALEGKIWVADFIFTTCTGPCPRMSSQMRQVQTAVKDLPDVKLVSFTVDPDRDTPEVLAEYARRYKAEPERWYFLTGTKETLHRLNREAFKLGNVDGSLDHSTRFVLIDRKSQVRGYYLTSDADALQRLGADIRTVLKETV
jgi:protein SCO1